jgi:hypothetical protein
MAMAAMAAMTACAENHEQGLDGEYRVAITQTVNTCSDATLDTSAPGLTTRLDLFERSDGRYDLRWVDGWVPDDFALTAVDVGSLGQVSYDSLDLTLVHRGTRLDTGEPCERRAVVRGVRRPMFDSDSVDGRYIVSFENRGGTCADGTTVAATGAWNMRMEVLPFRDDRTSVMIEDLQGGLMRFWIEPIGSGGPVALTHDVFFATSHDSIMQLDGTVDGTIEPDHVELAAEIVAKDDPRACRISYAITGSRWIPSATSIDAEYRTSYRMTDSCDPSGDITYEDVGFAVEQAGDRLDLIDKVIQSTVAFDGSSITGSGYSGTVTPDHTAYVITDSYTSAGVTCMLGLEVAGTARYR